MSGPLLCFVCHLGELLHHVRDGESLVCFCETLYQVKRGPLTAPTCSELPQVAWVHLRTLGEGFSFGGGERGVQLAELHGQPILTVR